MVMFREGKAKVAILSRVLFFGEFQPVRAYTARISDASENVSPAGSSKRTSAASHSEAADIGLVQEAIGRRMMIRNNRRDRFTGDVPLRCFFFMGILLYLIKSNDRLFRDHFVKSGGNARIANRCRLQDSGGVGRRH